VKRYLMVMVLASVCVLLLVAGPVLTVFGQESGGPEMNCNGLSDADCQILKDATVAMQSVHSFSMPAWAIDLNLDAGEQSVKFAANGHGAIVLPQTLMGLMGEMQGMTDFTDMGGLITVYQQLNADMLLQALSELGLYLAIEHAEIQSPDQSSSGRADVIYKDKGLYLRLEAPNGAEAWFGDVLKLTEQDLAEFDASIADLITQMQSEEFQQTWAQMSEFTGLSQQVTDLVNKYIVTTRGEDVDVMGQTMIVFTTTFDLKGLLSDPELPTLIMDFIKNPALAELGAEMGDLEGVNETQIQFVLMTVGLLLKDASFSAEQWVGADDLYFHKFAMDASLNIDMSLLGASAEVESVTGNASFSVEMANFNEDVMADVQAPAEYHSLDDTGNFLMGSPDMIEEELKVGQTFAASFSDQNDQKDIYSLVLDGGQSVEIELTSGDYPYLNLYGPDGFLVGEFDTYDTDSLKFTAGEAGTYLIAVEAYWEMDYEITIRAQ
jgi:hypothetical protein